MLPLRRRSGDFEVVSKTGKQLHIIFGGFPIHMKTKGKAWQLILTVLVIAAFVYTAFFGVAVKYGDVTTTYILSLIHISEPTRRS